MEKNRYSTKYLKPTVKYEGGSVMVWGAMSAAGYGKLTFIDCTMDRYAYCRILDKNLLASMDQLELINFVFQQDKDPKHTSKFVNDYLKENNIEVLLWLSQSPDLNPSEHLWSYMKFEYEKTPVTSKKNT